MSPDVYRDRLKSEDLPIPLYLNEPFVLEILATLESDFADTTTVQTTNVNEKTTQTEREAGLSIGNFLNILGAKIGWKKAKGKGRIQGESILRDLKHTPASHFASLRQTLRDRNIVHEVFTPGDLIKLDTGRFVEFEAAIWKSCPEAFLSRVSEITELELALELIDERLHKGKLTQDSQDQGNVQRQAKIATLEEAKVLSAAISRDNSQ